MIQAGRGVWGGAGGRERGGVTRELCAGTPSDLVKQLGAQGREKVWGVAWRVAVPTEPII